MGFYSIFLNKTLKITNLYFLKKTILTKSGYFITREFRVVMTDHGISVYDQNLTHLFSRGPLSECFYITGIYPNMSMQQKNGLSHLKVGTHGDRSLNILHSTLSTYYIRTTKTLWRALGISHFK